MGGDKTTIGNLYDLVLENQILESFSFIDSKSTKDGEEDIYEITLHKGLKYILHLNFITKGVTEYINQKHTAALYKKDNELAESYSTIAGTICMVYFSDERKRTNLTNQAGMSAAELFKSLKEAILQSTVKRGIPDAFIMRVSVTEPKRLKLYESLIKRFIHSHSNVFTDKKTEIDRGYILLIASRV